MTASQCTPAVERTNDHLVVRFPPGDGPTEEDVAELGQRVRSAAMGAEMNALDVVLTGVTHLGSSTLGLLVSFYRRGLQVRLFDAAPLVAAKLRVLKLDRILYLEQQPHSL